MTSLKSFSVILVCGVFLPVAFTIPINMGLDAGKVQLNYLGTIEGKSFFTEQNVKLTWQYALAFCQASGMRLASITTQAQLTMLKNAYSSSTFSEYVWTGARDSHTPTQFSWNHNNEVLNPTVHNKMSIDATLQTCVDYHPLSTQNYLHALSCTSLRAVLCEILIS